MKFMAVVLAYVIMIASSFIWYHYKSPSLYVGDDLVNFLEFSDAKECVNALNCSAQDKLDKFRPIANEAMILAGQQCGADFRCQVNLNISLINLTALSLSLGLMMFGVPSVISLLAFALVVYCRFAYYQLWQSTGLIEGVSSFFFVFWLLATLALSKGSDFRRCLIFSGLAYTLLIFSHERFLVLTGVFFLLALVGSFSRLQRLALLILPLAADLLNWIFKASHGIRFFSGTAGQQLKPSFHSILVFFRDGLLTTIGMNRGPEYLSIINFGSSSVEFRVFSILLIISNLVVLGILLRALVVWKKAVGKSAPIFVLIFMSTLGACLVSASICPRQEFRWLYTGFIAFIALICLGLSETFRRSRRMAALLAILIVISTFFLERDYRQSVHNLYFVDATNISENVEKLLRPEVHAGKVIELNIVTSDPNMCPYIFSSEHFAFYFRNSIVKKSCLNSHEPHPDLDTVLFVDDSHKVSFLASLKAQR